MAQRNGRRQKTFPPGSFFRHPLLTSHATPSAGERAVVAVVVVAPLS
jgi:hypothetical protein